MPPMNGLLGGLGNNSNLLLNLGAGFINHYQNPLAPIIDAPSLSYGMGIDRQGRESRETKNMTKDWLVRAKGLGEQDAEAAVANPAIMAELLKGNEPKVISVAKDSLLYNQGTNEWIQPPAREGGDPEQMFETEQKLRKEYSGRDETQNFTQVLNSYERMRTAAEQGTGAGDIAVVISYMKMLDPPSIVREGEYATVRNASGVPEQVRNLYNRLVEGDQLSPEMRQQLLDSADAIYKDVASRQSSVSDDFSGIASEYGVDPGRVVRPVPEFEPLRLRSGGTLTPSGNGSFIWSPQ